MTVTMICWSDILDPSLENAASEPAVAEDLTYARSGLTGATRLRTSGRLPRVGRGASEEEMVLDSPSLLRTKVESLRSRGFIRLNDPRTGSNKG
jgi:hypothetical protein